MNYRRWLIVGYMLLLMAFTTSILLIPGQKYDTLTTSDSGWEYDTAFEINQRNALADNNTLSHAPYGLYIDPSNEFHPLVAVVMYRSINAVNPSVTLMDVVKYYAPLVFALSLIPIFLMGREFGGDLAGCTAAFFAATLVSSIYWHKLGAFDREPTQLILAAWAMFLTIKLFKAQKNEIPKFALLTGLVYGLFGLAWAGWHYIIAILVGGVLLVLLVGFLGSIVRKPSDVFGAIKSAIRGHLWVLAGLAGVMLVITIMLCVVGMKNPEFWIGVFSTYTSYLGLGGGGGGISPSPASEMQTPSSWGDTLGKFYGVEILTAFILILVALAIIKFCWSRKRWELLTFAWLIVLAAMVWPGMGQARFERMWWPFLPVMAGVGMATLVSLARRFSLDPSGTWLRHLQNPITIAFIAITIAAPFAVNAYNVANTTTPPTEWHGRGLDEGFMEAFDWIQDNTSENSVVSIQWSFGHLLTGAARRATVCDGCDVYGEEGVWESDPSFVPRPPDYIYYVEGNQGLIYGMDVARRSFEINGRRIDVQYLPIMGEEEFRWLLTTYRDNYGVKVDYVIFSYDEYYNAYNYYQSSQPMNIVLIAERIITPSSLQPTMEGQNYVFNFGGNRSAVVLDSETRNVYLRTADGNLNMDGYGVLSVDKQGRISSYSGFFPPSSTPDIQETLVIFLDDDGNWVSAWLIKGVSDQINNRPIPMGIRAFAGAMGDIDYLQTAFTSSNGMLKILKLNHVPYPISPAAGMRINDNTPDLRWAGAIGASRYELLVDDDASFSSPVIHDDNITSTLYTATVALLDGDYHWKVAAYDTMNNLLGWSDSSTFTVDTQVPVQPQASGPQDGTELSTLEATFTWTEPEQGVTYDVQIDDENSFTTPYAHENTGLPTSSYAYTFERNGTYYWHVRAKDAAGNASEWSNTFTLTIRAPPQAPTLSSPENGTSTNDNTPALSWTGGNGDNYRLLFGTNQDLSSPTLDVFLAPSVTSYTMPDENALLDGDYYWKVVAVVGADENSSDVWTLTVDTVSPEAPVLYAPENGTETSDNTPTFEWSPSTGADNYRLVVDSDIGFGSPDIDVWLAEHTYTPQTELALENHYWKVSAKDAAGNENESSVWTFGVTSSGG